MIVIGGGLAGISAACRLAEAGVTVALVERRPYLGGRAFSFHDDASGWEVDNGQHIFLGCCTHYISLLRNLGVLGQTSAQDTLRVPIIRGGKTGWLTAAPLPAPFHLLPSLVGYPHLSWVGKLRVLYALTSIRFTDRAKQRQRLEQESFLEWLRRHRQSQQAIDNFWNLIVLPVLNDDVSAVSAEMGLMTFQEGLLKGRASAALGYSRVGLSTLVGEPAHRYLEARGSKLLLEANARRLQIEGAHVVGIELNDGQVLQGSAYVSGLFYDDLLRLLPEEWQGHPFFRQAQGLETAPIVGVHVWYDRPVTDLEIVGFLDSEVQWVFNKSRITGHNGHGQYLCVSLSGAWQHIDLPREELERRFVEELERLFPAAAQARVERVLVVKQPHATFRSRPGAERHRLPQRTPLDNLFLAGEWTQTGWPSTMESAVRSGEAAAALVLEQMGR